jgi:hypothetical protein
MISGDVDTGKSNSEKGRPSFRKAFPPVLPAISFSAAGFSLTVLMEGIELRLLLGSKNRIDSFQLFDAKFGDFDRILTIVVRFLSEILIDLEDLVLLFRGKIQLFLDVLPAVIFAAVAPSVNGASCERDDCESGNQRK